LVAEIAGTLGVPHTPFFPALVEREGPQCETARFFAAVTKELEAMRPDLIVMYDTDHLNTFFLDNLPIFAVGVTEAFKGPNDCGSDLHHRIAAGGGRAPAATSRSRPASTSL
jgi:gallate dioxygenase